VSLRRVQERSAPSLLTVRWGMFHRKAFEDLLPDLLSRSTILNDSDHAQAVHAHLNRSMAFICVTRSLLDKSSDRDPGSLVSRPPPSLHCSIADGRNGIFYCKTSRSVSDGPLWEAHLSGLG
jgi:hypothetical protein